MTPSIALPSLYREAVTSFESGKSPEEIMEYLIRKGLPETYARTLIDAALLGDTYDEVIESSSPRDFRGGGAIYTAM